MSDSKTKKKKKGSEIKPCSTPENCEENKPLTLIDVTCPVCFSIMIKPVSMPCSHALCMSCFELNVSESNLACPLCRKRISVWVRRMTKLNKLINETLWQQIQESFQEQVQARLTGMDDLNNTFTSTLPPRQVSAPGEIKEEYEDQLRKMREEEDKRKKKEEKDSEFVVNQLQKEERRRLQQLQNEREKLSSGDLEFAKELRASQFNQTLNSIRNRNAKAFSACGMPSAPIRSPPLGPMDVYLGQVTPTTSQKSHLLPLSHSTPITAVDAVTLSCAGRSKMLKKEISNEFLGFSNHAIPSSPPLSPSPGSSHPLKDITSQYSSESESEFDSEENIIKSKTKDPRSICPKGIKNAENKEKPKVGRSRVQKKGTNSPADNQIDDASYLKVLSKVLDGEEEIDEDSLRKFVEEQKAIEERLQQEKQDRIIALQLQKDLKKVDRTKGSEDEYCLRKSRETTEGKLHMASGRNPTKCSGRGAPSSSSSTNTSVSDSKSANTHSKHRQTTLLENITKKQRRL